MKRVIILLLLPCLCYSQKKQTPDEDKPKTQIEEIFTSSGTIIRKVYKKVATVRALEISVLTVTDNNNKLIKGVYLDGKIPSTILATHAYLDSEEIEEMLQYLSLVQSTLSTKEPEDNTEIIYNAKDDFRAFLYNSKGAYGSSWHYGFGFSKYSFSNSVEFKEKDIDELIAAFKKAKSLL